VLVALVAVVAALPFIGALGGPFLWDDTHLIENNPRVHTLARVGRLFTHSFFDTGSGLASPAVTYFRPLTQLTFATDWALGNGNPAVFHTSNLLLAMLVAGLAADCLLRWTRCTYVALLCSLYFAWHPTKAESVAWISGRTDLLATAFMLLACKARSRRLTAGGFWGGLELVASACAYASKESAILLPVFVMIEHWSTNNHPPLGARVLGTLVRASRWQWLGAVAYLVLRSQVFPLIAASHASTNHPFLLTRLGLVLETFGRAAHLLVYPTPQSVEHGLAGFDGQGQFVLAWPYVVLGCTFSLALLATTWLARRRAPLIALGAAVIFITLLPTANLVPTHLQCIFYERFLFLPVLGLALLLAGTARHFTANRFARGAGLTAILGILFAFAVRSAERATDYASAERLWQHEGKVNALSTIAERGKADVARASGDPLAAISHLGQCHLNAVARNQDRTAIRCAYDAAILTSDSVPDLDRKGLEVAERFFRALALPAGAGTAELQLRDISVKIDTLAPALRGLVSELAGESLAVLSSIELRLARTTAATHARLALASCETCRYSLRAARVLAATGSNSEALHIVDRMRREGPLRAVAEVQAQLRQYAYWNSRAKVTTGPERIHSRAQGYLVLGLYGAAYEVLQPHLQEFVANPTLILQYAQVAFYAGNPSDARKTLLGVVQPNTADSLLAAWAKGHASSGEPQ
jgi:hypothetical protein